MLETFFAWVKEWMPTVAAALPWISLGIYMCLIVFKFHEIKVMRRAHERLIEQRYERDTLSVPYDRYNQVRAERDQWQQWYFTAKRAVDHAAAHPEHEVTVQPNAFDEDRLDILIVTREHWRPPSGDELLARADASADRRPLHVVFPASRMFALDGHDHDEQ